MGSLANPKWSTETLRHMVLRLTAVLCILTATSRLPYRELFPRGGCSRVARDVYSKHLVPPGFEERRCKSWSSNHTSFKMSSSLVKIVSNYHADGHGQGTQTRKQTHSLKEHPLQHSCMIMAEHDGRKRETGLRQAYTLFYVHSSNTCKFRIAYHESFARHKYSYVKSFRFLLKINPNRRVFF